MILSYDDYLYNKEKLESALELVRKYKEGEELQQLEQAAKDRLKEWAKGLETWCIHAEKDALDKVINEHPEIKSIVNFDYVQEKRRHREIGVELEDAIIFIKKEEDKKMRIWWNQLSPISSR